MSPKTEATKAEEIAAPRSPDDALPPVEAPSMAFVTQLFLIPLLIVSIIVVIWLGVSWVVRTGGDPDKYVKDLQKPGKGSWQSAMSLADMLRDPRNEHLKRDVTLAKRLAEVLDKQLDGKNSSQQAIKLRIFLTRALGEFHVTDGLPVLIKAANTERDPSEIVVRRTALEAIAVLADNTDPAEIAAEPGLMAALERAATDRTSGDEKTEIERGELRARAAFALGVIGGDDALKRLEYLTGDAYPNARFNAATGLARHGDERATKVLLQMLDPNNPAVVAGETGENEKSLEQAIAWKRAVVLINGLEATVQLAERNSDADLTELAKAVQKLETAELDPLIRGRIRTEAKEVGHRLAARRN
jgi:HEAT repeat protein